MMVPLSEETKKVLVEIMQREVAMRTIGTDAAAKHYGHNTHLEYVVGSTDNLENLGLPPADLVLMRAVIRFVRHADRPNVFRHAYAVLKDNGKFLFDLPLRDSIDLTELEGTLLPTVGNTLDALYGIPGMRNAIDYTSNMSKLTIPQELEVAGFRNQLFTYFRAYIRLSDFLDKASAEFSYITQCPELHDKSKAKEELIAAKEEVMKTIEARATPYFATQQTAAQLFALAAR